jgi:uncharacterized phage infection (PIP) family protein YhgE
MFCNCYKITGTILFNIAQQLQLLETQNRRILKEIKKMALDQTKLQAGVDRITASLAELTQEFKDLNDKINLPNPADQKLVDDFGDKLVALGQAFSDISPDTPTPPIFARGRKG